MDYCVYWLVFRSTEYGFDFPKEIGVFYGMRGMLCCIGFFVRYFNRELLFKKKRRLWLNNLQTVQLGDRMKFVFSPDVILYGLLGLKHRPTNLKDVISREEQGGAHLRHVNPNKK